MQRRTFAAGLAAVAMSGCAVEPQPQTTLIVLRHADRDTGAEDINAVGLARANALPAALAAYPIDEIRLPDRRRNIQSAAPLALQTGLTPIVTDLADLDRTLWRAARGRTVVWIGNTTNLQALWVGLDAPGEPPLGYGEIAVLTGTSSGPTARTDLAF